MEERIQGQVEVVSVSFRIVFNFTEFGTTIFAGLLYYFNAMNWFDTEPFIRDSICYLRCTTAQICQGLYCLKVAVSGDFFDVKNLMGAGYFKVL